MQRSRRPHLFVAAVAVAAALGLVAVNLSAGTESSGGSLAARRTAAPTSWAVSAGDAAAAGLPTSGVYVADSGFRPQRDGFGFENYTDDDGALNLNAPAIQEIFGDEVCATRQGATCHLTPAATTWMQYVNGYMAGGHCDGMAALASRFYVGLDQASRFGAKRTVNLKRTQPLEREIARWWATQMTSPSQTNFLEGTPNDIVAELKSAYAKTPSAATAFTFHIFTPEGTGGHALTPYAIEDRGKGIVWILVYDNNFPRAVRAVVVNTKRNTWSYVGGVNPDAAKTEYEGGADTKNLKLLPLAGRLGRQQCVFCSATDPSIAQRNVFVVTGDATLNPMLDFYVSDVNGQRVGRIDGKIVNEIAGAQVTAPTADLGVDDTIAPMIAVPATLDVDVVVHAPLDQPGDATADLALIGAGFDVNTQEFRLVPGEDSRMSLHADGSDVTVVSPGKSTPLVSVGIAPDDPAEARQPGAPIVARDAQTLVSVRAHGSGAETVLKLSEADQKVQLQTGGRGRVDVQLDRQVNDRTVTIAALGTRVSGTDRIIIDISAWAGTDHATGVVVHANGTETPIKLTVR